MGRQFGQTKRKIKFFRIPNALYLTLATPKLVAARTSQTQKQVFSFGLSLAL